jgi:branched-chain amino acid aminotransferase
VLIVGPLSPPPDEQYSDGVSVISYRTQRQSDATSAEGAKVGNYLVAVLAMRAAREKAAVEALIVDGRGRALEGGSSNVFFVRSGRIVTPPEEAGILPGITRAHMIALAGSLGLEVELRTPELSELYAADEVFITSSIRELLPVVRLDDRVIGDGRPGPVATLLLERFRALTRRGSS